VRLLVTATITYNLIEGAVAITAGTVASSTALVGFGFDSLEVASASASAVVDSKQTLLCTYLSGVLFVGLALNAVTGWWWADPLGGLVMAGVAVREGREASRGEVCCETCCLAGPSILTWLAVAAALAGKRTTAWRKVKCTQWAEHRERRLPRGPPQRKM